MFDLAGVSYRQHVPALKQIVIDFASIEAQASTERLAMSGGASSSSSSSVTTTHEVLLPTSSLYADMTVTEIEEEIAKLQALKRSKES